VSAAGPTPPNPPQTPPPAPPPTPLAGTIRRGTQRSRRPIAWIVIAVIVFVIVYSATRHRETPREQLVTRVIQAVQHDNMSPVRNDFDTPARDSMTYEKVGHLADLLAPMGKLKSVTETTPKGSGSRHTYIAHFEKGDWEVIMPLDSNGKAEGFYMRRIQP
jgi:hypothetical protein